MASLSQHDQHDHISETTHLRWLPPRLRAYVTADERGRWALWINSPVQELGWRISSLSVALATLANRLCDDIPCNYYEQWLDGVEYGRTSWTRRTRKEFADYLAGIGIEPTDDVMRALNLDGQETGR